MREKIADMCICAFPAELSPFFMHSKMADVSGCKSARRPLYVIKLSYVIFLKCDFHLTLLARLSVFREAFLCMLMRRCLVDFKEYYYFRMIYCYILSRTLTINVNYEASNGLSKSFWMCINGKQL